LRIRLYGLPESGDGGVNVTERIVDVGGVITRLGKIRLGGDCPFYQFDGFFRMAVPVTQQSEYMQGDGVIGLLMKHLLIEGFGFL
jgi:hypothetical protein